MRPVLLVVVLLAACRGPVPAPSGDRDAELGPTPVANPVVRRAVRPPPHPVHGHRLHDLGTALLLFGGERTGTGAGSGTECWRLDDGATQWRRVGDLGAAHSFGRSAVVDGVVFALGGSLERFDAETGTWSSAGPDDVLPRSHAASAVQDGRTYTLGGFPVERAGFRAFDVARGTWERLPDPPDFRAGDHFHVLASLAGRLHLIGGLGGESGQPQDAHHVFDGATWSTARPAPRPLFAKFAVTAVHDERLFVFDAAGGLVYDPSRDSWSPLPPLPRNVAMPASVVRDGRLVVLGGMDVEERPFPSVTLVYDIETGTWTDLTPAGEPRGQTEGRRRRR